MTKPRRMSEDVEVTCEEWPLIEAIRERLPKYREERSRLVSAGVLDSSKDNVADDLAALLAILV
jgi:hypothetical protein